MADLVLADGCNGSVKLEAEHMFFRKVLRGPLPWRLGIHFELRRHGISGWGMLASLRMDGFAFSPNDVVLGCAFLVQNV